MEALLAEDEVGPRRDRQRFSDEQRLCFFRPNPPAPFVEFSKNSLSRFSSPAISDSCRLASLDGIFCACTVPSLRPSRKVHSSALRCLLRRPSHSCWPRPQSTAAPLDTGRDGGEGGERLEALARPPTSQKAEWHLSLTICRPVRRHTSQTAAASNKGCSVSAGFPDPTVQNWGEILHSWVNVI